MKRIPRRLSLVLVSFTFLALLAQVVAAQPMTGKGEWQSIVGEAIKGTWAVSLVRNGGHVQGNLDLTGSSVFSGGAVVGDIDKSSIMLGVMVDGAQQATFSGKLEGNSIKGEWQFEALKDSGVWFGTLAPAQSNEAGATK